MLGDKNGDKQVRRLVKNIVEQATALKKIKPVSTVSGELKVLKIRIAGKTRPERGDADFTVGDYEKFKADFLPRIGFKLIERPEMEMIELMDPLFDVRAYFSNPPLDKQLGLK